MKSNKNTLCRTVSLIAALFSLLFCGCANDVDPKLKAQKRKMEKNIAQVQAAIAERTQEIAVITAKQAVGRSTDEEDARRNILAGLVAANTKELYNDYQKLKEIDAEIHRQELIAPNLLVDVMDVKHFDTSNPHVFTHMPSTGTMTQTAPMPSAPATGHVH